MRYRSAGEISLPYFTFSKRYGWDYANVLAIVEMIEASPYQVSAQDPLPFNWPRPIIETIEELVVLEHRRRNAAQEAA